MQHLPNSSQWRGVATGQGLLYPFYLHHLLQCNTFLFAFTVSTPVIRDMVHIETFRTIWQKSLFLVHLDGLHLGHYVDAHSQ